LAASRDIDVPGSGVVSLSDSIKGVDWRALKAALAADAFDNGRTPAQLEAAFAASFAVVFAQVSGEVVGKARLLSDGISNAYLVDVWVATPHRGRGIGSAMVRRLLDRVPGQHVALFTSDREAFYRRLGFEVERVGMSLVVGSWLSRDGS
jgi:ribosomal protein S18 acetylase RimI-like enzyme